MTRCLIALGSNSGDRRRTLDSARQALGSARDVQLQQSSRWYPSQPVGIVGSRAEFLNGAAVVDTSLEPLELLDLVERIETDHGRRHDERWADRTLDLDLLLYEAAVLESPRLALPHPRMSFRRFVLEPAAEIAPQMVHPTIGWTVARLLRHLETGADYAAVVSPGKSERLRLAAALADRLAVRVVESPLVDQLASRWPSQWTTWIATRPVTSASRPETAVQSTSEPDAALPRLTILLDSFSPNVSGDPPGMADWSAVVSQPGRGPTLHLRTSDRQEVDREALAAFECVWPHLGSPGQSA